MVASEFSDVFVSYRRKNVDFTKTVVDELRKHDKEVWVDWEDIPPGSVGFTGDIERGIQGADAFICILSPDYMESEYCLMELEHAVKFNKKLIPVVYKKFEGYDVPHGIGHINWIYFTPHAGQENTFEESFPKVIDALDTDLEHLRYHKRLLLRALEWESNDEKNGFLLMDDELDEAIAWVADSANHDPLPTDLQLHYVDESRQLKERRQRMILTGVSGALVVSIILTIASIFFFFQAETARFQTNVRLLANRLPAISANDPFTARKIAEGMMELENIPLVAQAAAQTNLLTSAAVDVYEGHDDIVNDVEFLGDGDEFLTASDDGKVRRWDAVANEVIEIYEHDLMADGVPSIGLSPSQTHMLTGTYNDSVLYWDIESGEVITIFDEHMGTVNAARFLSGGERAISGDSSGMIFMWDVQTGDILQYFDQSMPDGENVGVYDIEITPDDRLMVTGMGGGAIMIWDVENGILLDSLTFHEDTVFGVDITADGTRIVSASKDNRILLWDVLPLEDIRAMRAEIQAATESAEADDDTDDEETGDNDDESTNDGDDSDLTEDLLDIVRDGPPVAIPDVPPFEGHVDEIWDVAFTWAEDRIISISGDRTVRVWDFHARSDSRLLTGHSGWGNTLAITPDDHLVLSGGDDGVAILWNLDRSSLIEEYNPADTRVLAMAISPDESVVAAGIDNGEVAFIDTATSTMSVPERVTESRAEAVGFLPDGTLWSGHCVDPNERPCTMGEIISWDTATQTEIARYQYPLGLVNAIESGENDTLGSFVVISGTGLQDEDIYEVFLVGTDGNELGRFAGHTDAIDGIAISPDGERLLTASRDSTVKVWTINDQQLVRTLEGHQDWVSDVAWFQNGTQAMSSSWDGTLIQWNIDDEDETIVRQFEGHQGGVMEVAIADDGRTALSGSRDSVVFLWDIENGEPVRVLRGHSDDVIALEWSDNFTQAYSASYDGSVRYWRVFIDGIPDDPVTDAAADVNICERVNGTEPIAQQYSVPQLCGNWFERTFLGTME